MVRRRYARLPVEVRRGVIGAARQGQTYREIVDGLDVSMGTVTNVVKPLGGVYRRDLWAEESTSRLSIDDRMAIYEGLLAGSSYALIGASLTRPRHKSTVCREVNANGGRGAYQPLGAHRRAHRLRRRAKATKLSANPRLAAVVSTKLALLWSPQQISAHLRETFSDDRSMNVSHETIYKSLYVQGRGELRRELTQCLRTGRAQRRPHRHRPPPSRFGDMVMISDRPAEIADRAVPGHWEGDLIIGQGNRSAVGTLVERTTRYVMLLHLPGDHSAETVRDAMTAAISDLPAHLARSITWDQGAEMAQHADFTVATGIPIYFCDPHAPWQRGSNENTNGLLRQYMPKSTNLAIHTPDDLATIAHSLNTRPRKTLGYKTPAHQLAQLVATTG